MRGINIFMVILPLFVSIISSVSAVDNGDATLFYETIADKYYERQKTERTKMTEHFSQFNPNFACVRYASHCNKYITLSMIVFFKLMYAFY
jgi:hypothetical protein